MKNKFLRNALTHNRAKKLLSVLLIFVGFQANSAIINQDTTTLDSNNNLEWLDMSFTDGQTYAYAVDNLNIFEGGGWRLATYSELQSLLSSAIGVPVSQLIYASNTEYYVPLRQLTEFMGQTVGNYQYENGSVVGNLFNTYDPINEPGYLDRAQFQFSVTSGYVGYIRDNTQSNSWDMLSRSPDGDYAVGSFLVRNVAQVTEPSVITLLALGLVGIGFKRRRRS
jgi:hypothetical protein